MKQMSNKEDYDDKFRIIKEVIELAVGNIAIFKAMNYVIDDNNYILVHQLNNSALIACIRFCNVFGTNSEDNHWKNFLIMNI